MSDTGDNEPAHDDTAPDTTDTDSDDNANEVENPVSQRRKDVFYDGEMCDKLRVPCRFVTEHPCCKLPQDIGMVARLVSIIYHQDTRNGME